jgi:amino-acid N-acetyltransferase
VETQFEAVRAEDAAAVFALLEEAHLPAAGLRDHFATTFVAKRGGQILGTVALEVYPDGALLRSVAVVPEARGQGLGRQLTEEAIRAARNLGVPVLYLLTTTAERYFPKFGFEVIDRRDVPDSVKASVEFTSACPASATVMRKSLQAPAIGL